jgi:ATP-dependent DNA helicase
MYHGSPDERAELRRTSMALSRKPETQPKKKKPTRTKKRRLTKHRDSSEEVIVIEDEVVTDDEDLTTQKSTFPVVITTYEMIIKDRKHLARYDWGQVIVDEGHRLKNMDSILMREIKKYPSAGRLLLTGTPLHVSSFETSSTYGLTSFFRTTWRSYGLSSTLSCPKFLMMWLPSKTRRLLSLHIVNFLSFYTLRFKIPSLSNGLTESRNTVLIHKLHEILRPFLLRRLKVDVERTLPPKKEYVLYAPLTERQREVYDAVVKGCLRGLLAGVRPGQDAAVRERERIAREIEEDERLGRVGIRTRKSKTSLTAKSVAEIGAEHQLKAKSAFLHNLSCSPAH